MTQFQTVRYINQTQPPPAGWSLDNPSIIVNGGNWDIKFKRTPSPASYTITVIANVDQPDLSSALTAGYSDMLLIP